MERSRRGFDILTQRTKKKLLLLFLIIAVYLIWNYRYEYITNINELTDTKHFKIHEIITTHGNYHLGADINDNSRDRQIYKDSEGNLFLIVKKGYQYNNEARLFAYSINRDLTISLLDSIPKNIKSIYYTYFASDEKDSVSIERNEYRKFSNSAKNPEVLYLNKEPYLLWLYEHFWDIVEFDLMSSGNPPRLASYYVKLYLKGETLKIQIPGDMNTSRAIFHYVNDPAKDRIVFLEYGRKMIAIESLE